VQRYVFSPLSCAFRARLRVLTARPRRMLARAAALTVSFVFVGALHDLYAALLTHRATLGATAWFGLNALILLAWETLARATRVRFGRWARTSAMLAMAIGMATFLQ
jgi:hypothetical protein